MKFPPHHGSIASLTPTISHLLGINPPDVSGEPALDMVVSKVEKDSLPLEKCLIIAQDAIGAHLWNAYESDLIKILPLVPLRVPLRAAFPPVTPVCFASIFTGAQPEVHGIQSFIKPVLECDTLFDALARANKKVAIVTIVDSCIDLIFRNRDITYFSEADDKSVKARTLDVIKSDKYDVIIAYQADYDDNLHKTEPFSALCLQSFRQHIADFKEMAKAANQQWKGEKHVIAFTPDHGAHVNESGKGDHGLDIPEDMDIYHCYGIYLP